MCDGCVFHNGRRDHKPGCRCPWHSGHSERALKNNPRHARPLAELLVENGQAGKAQRIKARLLKEGLIKDRCEICGLGPEWQGQQLVLPLDHRNGNRRDWRLENLRVLCPNCHTQTATFSGRKL